MAEKKKFEDNQPGMDQKRDIDNEDYQHTRKAALTGNQGRTSFNPGSTTQGGSDFGQGSHELGGESHHQGEQKNDGANYADESGRFAKAHPPAEGSGAATGGKADSMPGKKGTLNESRDDIPHGHGAHINEKESNAQEDYPGTEESENDEERDII